MIKNEKGYSLFITLVIVILFTILGLSLMTLTMNGSTKNDIRQDTVRAQDLSEKGMDYFVTDLEKKLTDFLGDTGRSRSAYVAELDRLLKEYKCDNKISTLTDTSTGSAEYCIETFTSTIDSAGKVNDLRKLVTIRSTGEANSKDSITLTQVEIGADPYPDELNYAIGTNKEGDKKGNLFLHGGSEIKGDMKVEGNIITFEKAYSFSQWNESILPRISPYNSTDKQANLVLMGKSYKLTSLTGLDYNKHIVANTFSTRNYTEKKDITELFENGYAPRLVERNPVKTTIEITNQKDNFYYNYSTGVVQKNFYDLNKSQTITEKDPSKAILVYQKAVEKCTGSGFNKKCTTEYQPEYDKNFKLTGTNSVYSLSSLGKLSIKETGSLTLNRDPAGNYGTLYTKGLELGDQRDSNINDKRPTISIDGSIFVEGNLDIKGADLETNAVIYVTGNVTIKYSTINGKNLTNGKKGSLIIFAKGNIEISNNSIFASPDNPSRITGFFYSEGDFEMKGVGSNIIVDGGISADNIVLNAIRGRANSQNDLEKATSQQKNYADKSRLKVHYNPDIITTYSDLRQKEPIIYSINDSTEKSRELK